MEHANLRSTVNRTGGVRTVDFPIIFFFPFLEIFLSFSEKNKFRHFFMSQIIFQSEKLVGRKNFKKQIGEIKKIYEKNFDREKFIKWKKQKMYIQKKTLAIIFLKKICMQRTKKIGSGQGAALVASAAAPAGAPRLPPRPAAARAAGPAAGRAAARAAGPAAARAAARIAPLAGERRRRSWGSRTWI